MKNKMETKLKKYNQMHLLKFFNLLSREEQNKLLEQINKINFDLMKNLYINSFTSEFINLNEISPIKVVLKKDNLHHFSVGKKVLENNEYAVITLAGGSGSRLGFNGPKGTYELNIFNKNISIFEILAKKLILSNEKYNCIIPWFIMTSSINYKETINFFKKNNYFDYNQKEIYFFIQKNLPILNKNGNLVLKDKSNILEGANGNGNVLKTLKESNLINKMKEKSIKWIQICSVDNLLLPMVDEVFLGTTISNNYKLASKSIFKNKYLSKDYVFCKYQNKPFLLNYELITEKISNFKNNKNEYLYRDINILVHLIQIDLLERLTNIDLKYHRAFKQENFYNENGNFISSKERNCFKFEQFIFDAFEFSDDMLIFRVEESDEYAPIKNKDGDFSPSTAIKLYENYYNSTNS